MARQSNTPVQFQTTLRHDRNALMSSGRAGQVVLVDYMPVLRGDSASGRVGIDIDLADMPKPLHNAVMARVQAWFVPKSYFPQFAGYDEFQASYNGTTIRALGQSDRTAPGFFNLLSEADTAAFANSVMAQTLGLHVDTNARVHADVIDAYNLVYNFRLAAHSSKLELKKYSAENLTSALAYGPAFWPSGRLSSIVPDYEAALIRGALDLDVVAGRLPVSGIGFDDAWYSKAANWSTATLRQTTATSPATTKAGSWSQTHDMNVGSTGSGDPIVAGLSNGVRVATVGTGPANRRPDVWAEMADQSIGTSLADIDKARQLQSFAKLRQAYAGNDPTGFVDDDAIVADLMQGFQVPMDQFNRPWLLDSKNVTFGMIERYSTDADALDASTTTGRAAASLSINLPRQDVGGVVIVTLEVLPERLFERMSDEFLYIRTPENFPNSLRDVLRTEPVDIVMNRRIDAKHSQPKQTYGYEPMNMKWQRDFTRLGGVFYKAGPTSGWTENRSSLWLAEVANPTFTRDHFLAPDPFPHDVFADQDAPAFEFVLRRDVAIRGLTQFGDVLHENNQEYAEVIDVADE